MHVAPLQASTGYYPHFTLSRARSNGFGYDPSDFRPFQTPRLIACALVAFARHPSFRVMLATQVNSLARYSKRTTEHLSALPFHNYQVSGSFNSLSRVLFNFPSRYYYSIGL
jgi:hypothetical protein